MKEELLHFIWKHQLIKPKLLWTTDNDPIEIIFAGNYNTNEGADFTDAKLKIGNTTFFGNIEVHIKASDWKKHHHQNNIKYNNVILHLVWQNDVPLQHVPTLELQGKIPKLLLDKYIKLKQYNVPVPCASDWNSINAINLLNIQERLLLERLEHKKNYILLQLNLYQQDWLQTKYYLLLQYLGSSVNRFGFEQLAQRLDYKILIKHADNLLQIEALLFGTAGFLEDNNIEDAYYLKLKQEFHFLQKKYHIIAVPKQIWNFLRMRPANFPTIKIALLASIIHRSPQLFHLQNIIDTKLFLSEIMASSYWDTHYYFGKSSTFLPKKLGYTSVQALLINYCIPLYYTYQKYFEQDDVFEQCYDDYEKMTFEQNYKVKYFTQFKNDKTAADSQFLLELYDKYCTKRRCMECKIAYQILKKENDYTQSYVAI